jgi:two-component system sensor histidine kinase GlrK
LIGFAAVIAPLIVAVVTAVIQVDRLARASRTAVLEAEIATQQSRSLMEQLTEMERALGQFQVLGDRDFFDIYLNRRQAFLNAIDNLFGLNFTAAGTEQLRRLQEEERALFARVQRESARGNVRTGASREWTVLAGLARDVLAESSTLIERQADFATSAANVVQRTLLLQAAAVIPTAVVLAGLFTVLITRPLRQIGQGIRRLGAREFSEPIQVQGPRDVEELGQQLDWLRRRIQELEQQKIAFLRHISHELKTPLTTLREGAELLVESLAEAAPQEAEISRIMRANSLRLQTLIEDLLQFGKTQVPITDLRISASLDLHELVRSAVANQALAASAKQIDVDEDLEELRIAGDENKIRIVVDNLLTNAVKYTPSCGRVAVSLASRGGFATIDVRDNGPGIAEADRERIFEPFYQGRAEYQSSVKGTGLGLAIAKEYVEAHDGSIEVISSALGAHFRVRFPAAGPRGLGAETPPSLENPST